MSHINDSNPQDRKKSRKIPLPRNINTVRVPNFPEYKINKETNNKATSKQEKWEFIIEYNDKNTSSSEFPPKTAKKYNRGNSAELRRYRGTSKHIDKKEKIIQVKGKFGFKTSSIKDELKQEVNIAKTEIINALGSKINEVKDEATKVTKTLGELKDILIFGFRSLISLVNKDKEGFEKNNENFEQTIRTSKSKEEQFKIEENSIKEKTK